MLENEWTDTTDGDDDDSEQRQTDYHIAGMAKANIFVLRGCSNETFSARIDKQGEDEPDAILAEKSSSPTGVRGEADEAGDELEDESE